MADLMRSAATYTLWDPTAEDLARLDTWVKLAREAHSEFVFTPNPRVRSSLVHKQPPEWTVALVTTAGVHRKDQSPFDVLSPRGDPSFREIPSETPSDFFSISDTHYDNSDADADINCLFPIDRLRELAAERAIGAVFPMHFGLMGFAPNPARDGWLDSANTVAARLKENGVDVALLTPG